MGIYSPRDHDGPHHGGQLLSAHYWRTMVVLTMEDIIVRVLLEDHDGSSLWRTLSSAHYWRTMMVLTKDIIVRALLEDHDGPHYGGHYCPHIIGGPHYGGHHCPHIIGGS
ncbi:hypothetical protein GLOIN_2v1481368 [Rhizophagus irregularis DAOM 181602=DAOM 197198]|nr:hypothetical protein GLOIN_2v1481368 [Rhizophagus irregularis DAOM 181602=DAOM 197198]CAG8704157.1 15213_t:CDS:2 [Rhizophagus irregularis]